MAAMLKNCRHLELVRATRTFFKRVRVFVEIKCFVSQFEITLYFWSVVCWTIAHYVSYNGVISGLSGVPVDLDSKLTHCTCLAMINYQNSNHF